MGLRLEWILIIAIIITSILTMSTKLTQKNKHYAPVVKELEFTNTTFTEVTTLKREGVAFGVHGVRVGGVLAVDKLRYHNDSIKLLLADKGTYKESKIYLDGNVTVHRKEGQDYYTEHAVYDKKTEILDVTAPFVAYVDKHVIRGTSMRYFTRTKEIYATDVDAVLYTKEK